MSTSRAAGPIRAWVDLYTRGLSAEVRAARRDEIDDDLWCQLEEADSDGRPAGDLDRELLARWLLGIPADVAWSLSHRAGLASPPPNPSPMTVDRRLGSLMALGGFLYLAVLVSFVVLGDGLWSGSIGYVTILSTMAGSLAFVIAGVGIVWQRQDEISPLGAIAPWLVTIGAIAGVGGTLVILAIGSAVLMFEAGRIGLISRRAWVSHVVTAIVAGIGLLGPAVDVAGVGIEGRLLIAALVGPYFLSWVVIGASLVRRSGPREAPGAA